MSSDQSNSASRFSPLLPGQEAAQGPGAMPAGHYVSPELLSSLSHELRSPLHTLNGFLEIVLDYDIGPLTEQQREYLAYVRSSAQRLTTLIEDGFVLLRGEESARPQQTEGISLASVLDGVIQATAQASAHKRIRLVREISDDLPPVHADRSRLHLAIQSILAAVLDSAQEDTTCSIRMETQNRSVVCHIVAAIASAHVEHTRKLIASLESHAVEAHLDSRGIQLAAARLIVEQHQGALSLALEQTGQFTVRFTLPSA